MSDPESGSRSKASPEPWEVEVVETETMACDPVRRSTPDVDVALSYALCPSRPTHPENVEVDASKVFLDKILVRMANAVPTRREPPPTIYKVPKELKRGDKDKGYEPFAVGIGPFAKNNSSTAQLEKYKWCCVRQLMGAQEDHPGLLSRIMECMKGLEQEIRASYSEDIRGNSDKLALRMVLDGYFILDRLFKYARLGEEEAEGIAEDYDGTQVIGRVCVWKLVASDLLLLENQIPFFVLGELFGLLWIPSGDPKDALVKGCLQLFGSLYPHMLQSSANSEIHYDGVHHLLHLIYLSIAGQAPQPSLGESDNIKHSSCSRRPDLPYATRREAPLVDHLALDLPQWIPCAKELEEAGVRFRKRKNAKRFLDIEFNSCRGVLKIPPLHLYDFSDKLFRNLIAFEQTYPDTRCDITTYAVFMDCLINTPEDMRILHLRGILVNQINGEQDASRFFSRICAQVRYWSDNNYLKDVMNKVNNYRGSRLHKWRAALVRNYFSNPWVAISVLAGGVLLLMTILQTIFTAMSTFNRPK